VRQFEQFADEALLAGDLPPIWMAYWSDPDKRDIERMEKGRDGLRQRDLPYLERVLGAAPAGGCLCGGFSMADVPMMVLAMVLEVDQLLLGEFPRVERYLRQLRLRPSYRAISPSTKVAEASGLR
jgi:glutathione S-transferase